MTDTLSTSLAHRYYRYQLIKLVQFFWLLGSAKPGVRHDKSSDRSAAKKTDDDYHGRRCPC